MSDQTRHGDRDRADASFDQRLRRLIADAAADAPPPPDPISFSAGVGPDRPGDRPSPVRVRWILRGAIGLAAAAALATIVVLNDDPSRPLVPADTIAGTAPVGTSPASTVSPVTSAAAGPGPTATAPPAVELETLGLVSRPGDLETYWLDYAVVTNGATRSDGGDAPMAVARYRTSDGDAAIEIRTTESAGGFDASTAVVVDGIEGPVHDTNGAEGCSSLRCSIAIEWDDATVVTVQWIARPGIEPDVGAGSQPFLDRVIEAAQRLSASGSPVYRPAVAESPTLSERGVVVADATGVSVRDGWILEPLRISSTPSVKAIGLPDGRVLVQTADNALPGELFVVAPYRDPDSPMAPFWPAGVPDDGSVRVDLEDAATIAGVPTLLFSAANGPCTGPAQACRGTVEAVPIGSSDAADAGDALLVADLLAVHETVGLVEGGFVDVDLAEVDGVPVVGGIRHLGGSAAAVPYIGSFDSAADPTEVELVLRALVGIMPEGGAGMLSNALDPDGYLVVLLDRAGIEVREPGSNPSVVIPVDGLLAPGQVVAPIESTLRRGPGGEVDGSVWLAADGVDGRSFVEVGVDGTVVQRIPVGGSATLTAVNR